MTGQNDYTGIADVLWGSAFAGATGSLGCFLGLFVIHGAGMGLQQCSIFTWAAGWRQTQLSFGAVYFTADEVRLSFFVGATYQHSFLWRYRNTIPRPGTVFLPGLDGMTLSAFPALFFL